MTKKFDANTTQPFLQTEEIGLNSDLYFSDWSALLRQAHFLAEREPFLSRFLRKHVINRIDPAAIMASVLAERLKPNGADFTDLYGLLVSIFTKDTSFEEKLEADLRAIATRDPACTSYLHIMINLKGFHALQTYRACHRLWQQNRQDLALWLSNQASLILAADIHPAAFLGKGILLDHGTGIVIGETAVLEDDVSILQNVTLGGTGKEQGDRHPKLRRGVLIGAGAKVLGNIEIGSMSKVAAGSVVLLPVPSRVTVAGVPAKIVRWHGSEPMPSVEMNQMIQYIDEVE